MHKLLAFDLDGTLAEVGKGMLPENAKKLFELEQAGYMIAICSGKPTYYLCGFARQLGLREPILVGENGAAFQFGIELPPKRYYVYPYSKSAKAQRNMMKALINRECGDKVWYQPNEVGLTPFPKDNDTFEQIQRLIDDRMELLDELLVYRHIDSFDLTPKNINKYNGLEYLTRLLEIDRVDVIAIGDGINDIPMFEFADIAIGVGDFLLKNSLQTTQDKDEVQKVDYIFATIAEVLDFIGEQGI